MTSDQAAAVAEETILAYIKRTGASHPDDIRKVLEMLLSKSARGIEKYTGYQPAMDVLVRTLYRVAENPAAPQQKGH